MTSNDIITPCTVAGKYYVCKHCVRNNWSLKERMDRMKYYSAKWEPDADGVCPGFVEKQP